MQIFGGSLNNFMGDCFRFDIFYVVAQKPQCLDPNSFWIVYFNWFIKNKIHFHQSSADKFDKLGRCDFPRNSTLEASDRVVIRPARLLAHNIFFVLKQRVTQAAGILSFKFYVKGI